MSCLISGSTTPKLLNSSRVESLRNASRERKDSLSAKMDENATSFMCHINCVSTYTSKQHIKRHLRKRTREEASLAVPSTSSKRLRSSCDFNFLQQCIFCGDECKLERPRKHPNRWKAAYLCRTVDTKGKCSLKDVIIRRARKRGDEWGKYVAFRVNSALSDLHAADARYHKECMSKFFSNRPVKSTESSADKGLHKTVQQMNSDRTRIWNSIELYELYQESGGTQLSRRSLISYICKMLQPDVLVLSSPGVASIIVFKSNASTQLRILDDTDDDCNARAISGLAKKIKAECLSHMPDPRTYRTHLSSDYITGECSETLLYLLGEVSPKLDSTLQAAMIGYIVLSAVCDQATSLQVGLSVLLNQQRGLLDQLHNFGVTTTYNELRRFRISAAVEMAKDKHGLAQFDNEGGLVQVVADNFDTQISSQNGQKSTHGLAIIITQAGQLNPEQSSDFTSSPAIEWLKWGETKASNLSLSDVNIQRSHGSKKGEMPSQYGQRVVPTLVFLTSMQVSMNRALEQDFKFLKEVTNDLLCPEYGGYNTKHERESGMQPSPKTRVVYGPLLDMPPIEPDTMNIAMVQAQTMTSLTGQEWTILTCDQQLYQVVVSITWAEKDLFPKFVPRLGGMHMLMSFLGAVGTLMSGTGLEDILKSTFAGVPKLLSGKKFPQNVRALRMVTEELLHPVFESQEMQTVADLTSFLDSRSQSSRTTKLWVECLVKPVLIILAFVRAEREADWPLHLSAVEQMMPYFFGSGHVNYARYGLYYMRSMQRLHPSVLERFMHGEHVMRHQDGLWNGIWSDLFIESTYMRYGKGPSGIIGSTLNESTLAIWALSLSIFGKLKQDIDAMQEGDIQAVITSHKEEQPARVTSDSTDRMKIREALTTCIYIFDDGSHPTGLINIYSGQIIDDPTVNADDTVKIGTDQWMEYERQWPNGFHSKLKKNIKMMTISQRQNAKSDDANKIVKTELIYARVIGIMASSRETVSTATLFSYELAPYPSALFDTGGEIRSTSKSVLKNKIKVECSQRNMDPPAVVILDMCAILWTIPWPSSPAKVSTFVSAAVSTVLHHLQACQVLHVVFDRYHENSIKSACRMTRAKGLSRVYQLAGESPLPKQAITLTVTANKLQIIKLIVDQLSSTHVPDGKRMIVTGPEPHPIDVGTDVMQESVAHEEADVLMAYHMINEAVAGYSPIKVVSDDTDVLVILAHHLYAGTNDMPPSVKLIMESCSRNRAVIDVNEVVKAHAKIMPNLMAAHAFTGCDSVSCFAGIGKATAVKKLQTYTDTLDLGVASTSLDEVIASCLIYVAKLYGQGAGDSLNEMRAASFTRRISGKRLAPPKLSSLPPTMSAFRPHCARAHYQAVLWRSAGMSEPPTLDPLKFGWEKKASMLRPICLMGDQQVLPEEVLNLVSCGCKRSCKSTLCSCSKYSLPCTEICKCRGEVACENPLKGVSHEDIDSGDNESDDIGV